ncbi:MAG: methylenetetrahydrofolate reductase [NAD(P)H] [Solirubrobacteraceae bacterium]
MRIDSILESGEEPVFSFEFFPPKSEDGERNLYAALEELRTLEPNFVSVTWGAGGSTREKTIEIVTNLRERFGLEAMAHFTCVGASVDDLHDSLRQIEAAGIENVLLLRGDPPQGEERFEPAPGGLSYASELAELVAAAQYPFCVVGACYPEVHQEAAGPEADLEHLVAKVRAGVRVLITQLFFDNADYFRFVDQARAAGIDVPIIPGIMPITTIAGIKRMTSMCGACIPPALQHELELRAEHPEAVVELGVSYATLQCAELLARGAPGIHFYTINRSPSTRAILSALKLQRPWDRARLAGALG